ncbi:MAG: BamA/TamA family outer membrane protein [Bacteroidales bacterium]
MITRRQLKVVLYTVTVMLLFSCSPSRYLGPKDHLLVKNRIKADKNISEISELQGFIQQKPNRSFFGFMRFRIWAYHYASRNKETRFKHWLLKSVADKPVVLDTHLCNVTSRNMKAYLNNIGYFQSKVSPDYRLHRKFARVTYKVRLGPPYIVRSYQQNIPEDSVRQEIQNADDNRLVRTGDVFNAYTLDKERERLNLLLKNKGYYLFNKDYISYQADSVPGKQLFDIKLFLSSPELLTTDTSLKGVKYKHNKFRIRKVNIFTDYNPMSQETVTLDSLDYLAGKKLTENLTKSYSFYFNNSLTVRPKTITQNLFLMPGELFRVDDVNQTYTRLIDLQYYRYVNIGFLPDRSIFKAGETEPGWLDCNIQLTRNKLSVLSTGTEGTNNGGDFGIAANVLYENRNLFRGAELLNVRLKGAMEVQKRFGDIYASDDALFNTFETGLRADLVFPKFLIPINQERFSRYFRPKTTINAGVNFQQRSSYKRYLVEVSYGYEWRESQSKRHILYPIEINSVSIFPDSTFTNYLNTINDSRLEDQYTDHLIMALKYSYIFNNQNINKKENFFYLRFNFESAGNLLNAINKTFNTRKDENGQYGVFNIKYAQYLKFDADFRYYNLLGPTTLVYRASMGLGYAYGNSSALPFDKGFYSGGANGMRGWAIRSLGPGSFSDAGVVLRYDKMGDVFMETNLEFRFPVIGWFTSAVFTDAGNIWLLKHNDQYPDGEFNGDTFFRQLALDAGLGFRMDFSFFVFRLDGALQLRNPAVAEAERWIKLPKVNPSDIMWNFGIGYPF